MHNGKWAPAHLFSLKRRASGMSDVSQGIFDHLVNFATLSTDLLLSTLSTHINGLTEEEAETLREHYGINEIVSEKPPTWYQLFVRNLYNPFVLLLTALSILSFALKNFSGGIIILVMVFISIFMRFIQEFRSNKSATKLKALISTKATVYRQHDGTNYTKEVPFRKLVPGDVIHLSAGDMLPADVRILSSRDFFVSQSSLTGESLPLEKHNHIENMNLKKIHPLELPNICLMGTNVVSGIAKAVIISTGSSTYFGMMAKKIISCRPPTSFDIGINKVSWLLLRIMFCMVPLVFIINGLDKQNWFEALLFALSVAVGLTPELLPMIVTANLAKGATNMSKDKVIVKQLNSIQNFGAMNILCTDKTGTLTQDRIILEQHLNLQGDDDEEVLRLGFFNSYFQTGLKNLLDVAVLEASEEKQQEYIDHYEKFDEIPFDFKRKRMSVVVKKAQEKILVCKGSLGTILPMCTCYNDAGKVIPLDSSMYNSIQEFHDDLNNKGMRILAVAYKDVSALEKETFTIEDESQLVLAGFLAFLDPPKSSTAAALKQLDLLNIKVKILTGDNEVITQRICDWVDLMVEGVLTGPQIQKMSDEELSAHIENTTIFAKMEPLQKSRVIVLLKKKGHTVGYLGDGINDAPALHEADLGISVDTAVDIAKESSDIIMLEKNLLFLAKGVKEGRRTFGNIIKYIKMSISSNFGNVFSILGASILLPFLPLMPVQLLLQNLLYDLSQLAIPFDKVDESFLSIPRKWDPRGLARFMFWIGPISSIFDYVTFAVLWFFFRADSPSTASFFQSGWFIEGLFSQTLIVHMIRTEKVPFLQSFPAMALFLSTVLIMAIGLVIPFTQLGASIGLQPLPASYFYWLVPILLVYCMLVQAMKYLFIKRFHSWL